VSQGRGVAYAATGFCSLTWAAIRLRLSSSALEQSAQAPQQTNTACRSGSDRERTMCRRRLTIPYRTATAGMENLGSLTGPHSRSKPNQLDWFRRAADVADCALGYLNWADSAPKRIASVGPESAPQPSFLCERKIGFTAQNMTLP
jgi:hypothetical protein